MGLLQQEAASALWAHWPVFPSQIYIRQVNTIKADESTEHAGAKYIRIWNFTLAQDQTQDFGIGWFQRASY